MQTEEQKPQDWLGKMRGIPSAFVQLLKQQASVWFSDASAQGSATMPDADTIPTHIPLAQEVIRRVERRLAELHALQQAAVMPLPAPAEDLAILADIRAAAGAANRNNVTRTQAYWACYRQAPELHWALLAHMVSRNGGWCMTDLRGELLPLLMKRDETEHFFAFLERANALIFQDAYPQLLLYLEGRRRGRSLFHLLPFLNISLWMTPIWEAFWQEQDSALLTIGLIVNEQHYIEQRVVQNSVFQQTVINTSLFKTQGWLQLNQVGFPYGEHDAASTAVAADVPLHVAGLILEKFADVRERIAFGKSLYGILFGIPHVHAGIVRFASSRPHTGSRADYWPQLFAPIRKAPPAVKYQERLDGLALKAGASPFYSPPLGAVWPDRPLAPVEPGDWFLASDAKEPLAYLREVPIPSDYELAADMRLALSKLELAVLAAQAAKKLLR
ncbi:DUF2515 family protein [Paenibacillus oryzisoli]|uniref:DUF2515 family protein n=1 Tax=Paenibacillus oryzisoli TaxID=1850517 RepID=UPI003D2D6337